LLQFILHRALPLNRHLRTLAVQHRAKGIATSFVLVDAGNPAVILGY